MHVDALRHGEPEGARHQRLRLLDGEVILVVAALGRDIERVAKAVGGDQRGARAAPLDDRVGGERRAVDERVDVGEMQARVAEHQARALQHALLGPLRRGEHFPGEPFGVPVEHDVGERAADIDRHADVRTEQLFRSSHAIEVDLGDRFLRKLDSRLALRIARDRAAALEDIVRTASPSIPGCCS